MLSVRIYKTDLVNCISMMRLLELPYEVSRKLLSIMVLLREAKLHFLSLKIW